MPHLDEGVVVGTIEISVAQAERVKAMDDGGQGPSVVLIAWLEGPREPIATRRS